MLRHFTLLAGSALWGLVGLRALEASPPATVSVPGLSACASAWCSAPPSGPLGGVPVRNFGVVTPGCLYRSAQPGDGGFQWLAQNGLHSIVCLRKESDDGADRLRALGLAYLYLPIPDNHAPTDEQARSFLEFVRDPAHWPVLVHCEAGSGRAGTMVALARYAIDGWSMSDAMREARKYRPLGVWLYGEQRRWLNRWKDRFPPGDYHPSRPLPPWSPVATLAKQPS